MSIAFEERNCLEFACDNSGNARIRLGLCQKRLLHKHAFLDWVATEWRDWRVFSELGFSYVESSLYTGISIWLKAFSHQ